MLKFLTIIRFEASKLIGKLYFSKNLWINSFSALILKMKSWNTYCVHNIRKIPENNKIA